MIFKLHSELMLRVIKNIRVRIKINAFLSIFQINLFLKIKIKT